MTSLVASLPVASPSSEDALIPLSALQHWLFCPRQCALIHVEQLWAEDGATMEGRLLHEQVDAGHGETRPGIHIARGVQLRSLSLGVSGNSAVVSAVRCTTSVNPNVSNARLPCSAGSPGSLMPPSAPRETPGEHDLCDQRGRVAA